MALPKAYAWLAREPGPRLLVESLKTFGTIETPGPGNNPSILAWAKKTGLDKIYKADSTAWCGLWQAYVALQAGWEPPLNPLWAQNWLKFGNEAKTPMLGDVLVFGRKGGGHVALYVGEDKDAYHCLGGNQSDQVCFKRIAKSRLLGARRCPWRINQPGNVRVVEMGATGVLSTNEA